ncbi:TfuA-like protein [Streptomyces sp. NPDC006333]|uniref:TfuA-like protein n=1 Tax=Streptomyces sp. NPDC006333 TaxID=3156753 RepID=UPI0033B140DC
MDTIQSGDVVVVIDGYYHHQLGPRHKEYLGLMHRGVSVIGASSIGALRAAELEPYGMTGVGQVFNWYKSGRVLGDDAVAVAHSMQGAYESESVPLVNILAALDAAVQQHLLAEDEVIGLMTVLGEEYYPLRSHRRVQEILLSLSKDSLATWYSERISQDGFAFDQKRRDCLEAVAAAYELLHHRRHETSAVSDPKPIWRTSYYRRWSNFFVGVDTKPALRHRIAYQRIFNPDFPDIWWNYLRSAYRWQNDLSADSLDLVVYLRERLGHNTDSFTRGQEPAEWVPDLLCPVPDLTDTREVSALLCGESAADIDMLTDFLQQHRGYAQKHPSGSEKLLSDKATELYIAKLWNIDLPGLRHEGRRRGMPEKIAIVNTMQPFVVGSLGNSKIRDSKN